MGNSALRTLATLEETPLSEYAGATVAIDAHHWIYRYLTGLTRYMDDNIYTTEDGTELPNVAGVFRGLPPILREDITPVFVFDGKPHERKADEIQSRRDAKQEAKQKMADAAEAGDTAAMKRYKAQTQSLTPAIHETTREALELLGIPYIEAGGAGEAYTAKMVEYGLADAAMTDDYDALLFGSPTTIRQYTGKGPAEKMLLNKTLHNHGITHEQLVDIGLMCGTDYNDGISGIGPKRGVKYITSGKTVEEILEDKGATIDGLSQLRELFLSPTIGSVPDTPLTRTEPDFAQFRAFANEWEFPTQFIEKNISRFPRYAE
ncbi:MULTISPECIES: flap structure-specific endonuclease [Haloferacaceae]|uniref:Flap structure-specific endonuclease n=2 Tax=Haloferacaceae TaxID=1644056 RepID=A0ABD6DDQ2_9EURY|nr:MULTISPECIES: flap structure-specific endonuclease [Halorubraceae]